VRVLSRLFRRPFLEELAAAFKAGELKFFSDLAGLAELEAFKAYVAPLRKIEWVVFAKRPFAGPSQVLAYLARYTHRVVITNGRLVALSTGNVSFRWKDYRQDGNSKIMTLAAGEFIRRFLLHTLPDGFHRIRHYGLFANGHRADMLNLCRTLLDMPSHNPVHNDINDGDQADAGADLRSCPCCGGRMQIIETFDGPHASRGDSRDPPTFDSS
jgi:Putative transposase